MPVGQPESARKVSGRAPLVICDARPRVSTMLRQKTGCLCSPSASWNYLKEITERLYVISGVIIAGGKQRERAPDDAHENVVPPARSEPIIR